MFITALPSPVVKAVLAAEDPFTVLGKWERAARALAAIYGEQKAKADLQRSAAAEVGRRNVAATLLANAVSRLSEETLRRVLDALAAPGVAVPYLGTGRRLHELVQPPEKELSTIRYLEEVLSYSAGDEHGLARALEEGAQLIRETLDARGNGHAIPAQ